MPDPPIVIKNWGPGGRQVTDVVTVPVEPPASATTTVENNQGPFISQQSPSILTRLTDQQNEILLIESQIGNGALAQPTGPAQILPDANTVLLASRRRTERAVAQTQDILGDLLPDGTELGERRTLKRDITSVQTNIFKNRVLNSNSTAAAWLNGPGEIEICWDGGQWNPVGDDIKERILTPYDFGGVGDGVTNDYAALQAWLDALAIANKPCVGLLPVGDWRTESPLTFSGGGSNFHSALIMGRGARSYTDLGSRIFYDGAVTTSPLLTCIGLVGSTFLDIRFDANSKAKFAVLAHIESGVDESSSGLIFMRCAFRRPNDVAGAKAVAFGPAVPTPSTQTDTIQLVDCKISGTDSGYLTNADGFGTLQNGNTKNFSLTRCEIEGFRRGIDWEYASGILTAIQINFAYCQTDAYQGNSGRFNLVGAQSERSGRAFTQVGAGGFAKIQGWEWNGGRINADSVAIAMSGGQIIVEGVHAISFRARRTITSITPATNTIAFNGDEDGVGLDNGEEVEIRSLLTYPTYLVGGLTITYAPGTKLYVRDVVDLGGGLFTCKTSLTLGGAEMDWNGAGSGPIYFVSPVKLTGSGLQEESGVACFQSSGCEWDCAVDHMPIFEGANDLLGPAYAVATNANGVPTNISSLNDRGGINFSPTLLRSINGSIVQSSSNQIYPVDPAGQRLFNGANGAHWYVEKFSYTDMTDADTAQDFYRRLPARAIITQCLVEIVVPFVNASGNTTLNLYEAYAFGTIITACNLEAAAGTVYGLTTAERGTRWVNEVGAFPALGVGGYTWATPWLMLLNFVTAGANVNTLTAGQAIVSVEYTVAPRSGS